MFVMTDTDLHIACAAIILATIAIDARTLIRSRKRGCLSAFVRSMARCLAQGTAQFAGTWLVVKTLLFAVVSQLFGTRAELFFDFSFEGLVDLLLISFVVAFAVGSAWTFSLLPNTEDEDAAVSEG